MTTRRNPGGKVMGILAAAMCILAFFCYALPFASIRLFGRYEFSGFELIDRAGEEGALLILSLLCTLSCIAFGFIGIKVRKIAIGGIVGAAFAFIFMIAFFADDIDYMDVGAVLNILLHIVSIVFFIICLAKRDLVEETEAFAPVAQSVCATCGNVVENNAAFCMRCGTPVPVAPAPVPAVTFCTNCGSQLADGAAFCANCGAPRA